MGCLVALSPTNPPIAAGAAATEEDAPDSPVYRRPLGAEAKRSRAGCYFAPGSLRLRRAGVPRGRKVPSGCAHAPGAAEARRQSGHNARARATAEHRRSRRPRVSACARLTIARVMAGSKPIFPIYGGSPESMGGRWGFGSRGRAAVLGRRRRAGDERKRRRRRRGRVPGAVDQFPCRGTGPERGGGGSFRAAAGGDCARVRTRPCWSSSEAGRSPPRGAGCAAPPGKWEAGREARADRGAAAARTGARGRGGGGRASYRITLQSAR